MGKKKKGKKKKKSKEELEAERLQREEEERIRREEEAKRLEEERIAREKAHKERQEFLTAERLAELTRLRQEQDDSAQEIVRVQEQLQRVVLAAKEDVEWKQYLQCSTSPDPLKEQEMNTFMEVWLNDGDDDLNRALRQSLDLESVVAQLKVHVAAERARLNDERADTLASYATKLRDAQMKKLDFATSYLLNNTGDYTNEKNECKIADNFGDLKFGLWVKVTKKQFRLKVVEFSGTGVQVDVPRPLSLHRVALRIIYHPAGHVIGGGAEDGHEVPVGGVIHIDLLQQPAKSRRVKGWVMRQVTELSSDVGRLIYPPGSSDSAAASNAPPIRVKCTVPSHVVVPEPLTMAAWDDATRQWTSDMVSEPSFDPDSRLLSFHTTQMRPIAIVQPRHLDMPISSWSITPTGPSCATLRLQGSRLEFEIDVDGSECRLRGPSRRELDHILDKPFAGPGPLLESLKRSGINLCPVDEDAERCQLPSRPGQPLVVKNSDLESLVEKDVCTLASAFTISGSVWNQQVGPQHCVFRIHETEIDDSGAAALAAGETKNGEAEGEGEEEEVEWKTVLYSMDAKVDELENEVTDVQLLAPVKCLFIKGGEAGDTLDRTPEPAAASHAYLKYCLAGKCTPEALENMAAAKPTFTQCICDLMHMTRLLSFS